MGACLHNRKCKFVVWCAACQHHYMCLHEISFTNHADVDGCLTVLCGQKLCPNFLTIVQQKMGIAKTD